MKKIRWRVVTSTFECGQQPAGLSPLARQVLTHLSVTMGHSEVCGAYVHSQHYTLWTLSRFFCITIAFHIRKQQVLHPLLQICKWLKGASEMTNVTGSLIPWYFVSLKLHTVQKWGYVGSCRKWVVPFHFRLFYFVQSLTLHKKLWDMLLLHIFLRMLQFLCNLFLLVIMASTV
jgi:hypothetical protein